MKSTHWLLLFICFEMEKEYWTETQWRFLKKCCNENIRLHNIEATDSKNGIYAFQEIVFENVLHKGLVIIGKYGEQRQFSNVYSIPSEHFRENYHEMPIWVRSVMRVVFDYWTMTYKLNYKFQI